MRAAVAIIACWWVAKGMDFGKIGETFSKSWLILAGVIFVFVLCQIILAIRWWLFMRAWDIYISCWSAIKLTFLGLYFSNFLPGSVGGDLVRAWYVSQYTHKKMASVISVFMDRVLALLGTVLMAVTALAITDRRGIFTRQEGSKISSVFSENRAIILVVIGVVAAMVAGVFFFPKGRSFLKTLFVNMLHHGKNAAKQVFQAGLMLMRKPWLLPESLLLTFVLQAMVVVSLWVLGRQMGIPTELKMYFVFFPVMWVIGSIPISIAGIGIVEGGLIMLFMQFGAVQLGALSPDLKPLVDAMVLSQRVVWLIVSLLGLVIYLSGKHLPANFAQEFSVDEKQRMQ
jgi:uncharacterized protein (TIRG00374 family)